MGLLDANIIENLIHSSSVSKGVERTIAHIAKELHVDSFYIVRYNEGNAKAEVVFDYERDEIQGTIDYQQYMDAIREWYHFDEQQLCVIRVTDLQKKEEKEFYESLEYSTIVEYQMENHGNIAGYIVIGWKNDFLMAKQQENDLHVLLKLMSELLVKQFQREIMGINDWKLFQLAGSMTQTIFYLIDDAYKIQYVNRYTKDAYPEIKIGETCYAILHGEKKPCEGCPVLRMKGQDIIEMYHYIPYLQDSFHIKTCEVKVSEEKKGYAFTLQKGNSVQTVERRESMEKKLIYTLGTLYKDIIAVEIRRDMFYNLLKQDVTNHSSYSIDFVLKWLSKLHVEDKQKFLECFDINFLQNDYRNGVKRKEIDFRYKTHQGEYHCMHGNILFEYSITKEAIAYILFTDVEAVRRNQMEEQKKMMDSLMAARSSAELKGELLASISHEIRTPMSGIVSMSSVAKQVYKQEDKLLECLSNIDEYADHMMQVMDSLLEIIQVDDNAITITKQPFRLEQLLNRIDIAVRHTIEKKNVHFHIENQCRYNQLMGDEIRLYQAMLTLLRNTISYIPISGKIRLTTKQIAADMKNVFIRFEIEDTGNGLTEKMKESIFGFQHKEENGYIEEEHFELSLAAKLIRLMGGDIGIHVTDKGTNLYFTLPLELNDEEKGKSVRKKKMPSVNDFNGKRVLLAEDNEMARGAIRAVLEVVGFDVDTVDNGKKAVIQFISKPPKTYDVILMDVHMPHMDGREATGCIRISGKEDSETIPIIGLMANTYEKDIKESLKAGMQEHLGKPVDVDKLYKVLRKVIPEQEQE